MTLHHPSAFRHRSGIPQLDAQMRELQDRAIYRRDARDSGAYRFGKWLQGAILGDPDAARFCRDHKLAMTKAENEGLNDYGAAVVPDELAEQILARRELYGVARRHATIWPLRFGGAAQVPRRTAGVAAAWTSEGAAIADSNSVYDSAALTPRKLTALVKASTEIEEDALAAWGEFLVGEFSWAFAQAEDNAAFNGDGTSTYGGIAGISTALLSGQRNAGKITAASGHNSYGTLDATDVGALLGAVPKRAHANARLFVSMAAYGNTLVRLAAAGGGLVAAVGADGELRANFCGFPVELVPSLPASTSSLSGQLLMVAGDMTQAVALGERRQITVRRLAERFVDIDQVAFLATERVDINPHDLGDNTNPGALVGLFAP